MKHRTFSKKTETTIINGINIGRSRNSQVCLLFCSLSLQREHQSYLNLPALSCFHGNYCAINCDSHAARDRSIVSSFLLQRYRVGLLPCITLLLPLHRWQSEYTVSIQRIGLQEKTGYGVLLLFVGKPRWCQPNYQTLNSDRLFLLATERHHWDFRFNYSLWSLHLILDNDLT